MRDSPITDKHLSVPHHYDSLESKFRDVRKRANMEYKYRKSKRNRQEKLPKYKVDDEFVASNYSSSNKIYCLVKVIDFYEKADEFSYFCILLKTTDRKMEDRIGRIVEVSERSWFWGLTPAKVTKEGIKWR